MADDNDTVTTATHDDGQPAKRKRIRIPKSCIPCLRGKRACDRGRPACGRCVRSGGSSDCSYDPRLPENSMGVGSISSHQRGSDDSDDEDNHIHHNDSRRFLELQGELEEARKETKRLQHLLQSQTHRQTQSPSQTSAASHTTASPSSANRARAYSRSQHLNAAEGLQLLAEIAGPNHQDAVSNAGKTGILNWPDRSSRRSPVFGSHASGSSAPSRQSFSTNRDDQSPTSRSLQTPSSSVTHSSAHRYHDGSRASADDDVDSPKNINGTQIYYGDDTSSDQVLRKVAAGSASASQASGASSSTTAHMQATSIRKDVRTAFNSVLDPSRDTFPFATIWSSGTDFIEEIIPFFPLQEEFDSICASFVRHFSAMCPALTIPTAINHARDFSRMSREEKSQVSLPWLAVFLMICALGKNCDLESTSVSVDRKVRMLDAFLSGEASQQPSMPSSPRPNAQSDGDWSLASSSDIDKTSRSLSLQKSPAMVSDLFLSAAYQSLRLCSFLSSPTLQTIHAQLLIGSYLLNTERAASFWPLLGSVARQAQSIGLHVDPYKIKSDWDPVEADIRRRLWWAIVHQDVILSGIFRRPLGITRFSCKFPGTPDSAHVRTYATLQCEFSQFAREYLDENQDHTWTQQQITNFTEKVLQWYMDIPAQYRPDLGRIDLFGSETEAEAIQNYTAAGVDLNTKGLMEVHQSGNLAVEVFYTLLSLHRSNLLPHGEKVAKDTTPKSSKPVKASKFAGVPGELNEISLHICAQALRRITRAQQTMSDVLGRARATMFWKIAYYTYQAAIAGAYIVFLRPQSKHAESALEDLATLTDYFDRMPERWTGLKTAKHGLRVLRKLAVAARENPKAASMPLTLNAVQSKQVHAGQEGQVSPFVGHTTPHGAPSSTSNYISASRTSSGPSSAAAAATTLSPDATSMPSVTTQSLAGTTPQASILSSGVEPSTPSNLNFSGSHSAFLPPLFSSSFLSPAVVSPGPGLTHSTIFGGMSGGASMGSGGGPPSFGSGNLFGATSSSGSRSFANTPLVTLFNNTYDQQEDPSKAAFCYDPFIPEALTHTTSEQAIKIRTPPSTSGTSSSSPSSNSTALASTSTGFTQTSSTSSENASGLGGPEPSLGSMGGNNAEALSAGNGFTSHHHQQVQHPDSAHLNQKDLANYWSEYFSLQLDWDRLSGLT